MKHCSPALNEEGCGELLKGSRGAKRCVGTDLVTVNYCSRLSKWQGHHRSISFNSNTFLNWRLRNFDLRIYICSRWQPFTCLLHPLSTSMLIVRKPLVAAVIITGHPSAWVGICEMKVGMLMQSKIWHPPQCSRTATKERCTAFSDQICLRRNGDFP